MNTALDLALGDPEHVLPASGPPAVAMATAWLVPVEPKPGKAGEGRSRLCRAPSGVPPPRGASCGRAGARRKPRPWRRCLCNVPALECELVGLAAALKPEFCSDMFSGNGTSLSPGLLNFQIQWFLPHWVGARFKWGQACKMLGTVPEAKWALLINNNDNSLFANCGPRSHSALMTPPVNIVPLRLYLGSASAAPSHTTVLGGVGPHPSLPLSRAFFGHLPAGLGLLSWSFSSLPAPLSLLPPTHLGARRRKGLKGETGVLPFWPFGGAVWCSPGPRSRSTARTGERH